MNYVETVAALRAAFTADDKAQDAIAKAKRAWAAANDLWAAEYGPNWVKYAQNPGGKTGVLDNRHPDAYVTMRETVLRARLVDDAEYTNFTAQIDNPLVDGTATFTFSYVAKGAPVKRTLSKKDWQSWRHDQMRTFIDAMKNAFREAQPKGARVTKTPVELVREYLVKIEAKLQKAEPGAFDTDIPEALKALRELNKMIR